MSSTQVRVRKLLPCYGGKAKHNNIHLLIIPFSIINLIFDGFNQETNYDLNSYDGTFRTFIIFILENIFRGDDLISCLNGIILCAYDKHSMLTIN